MPTLSLDSFVNDLQASGRYTFQRKEALDTLGISEAGFRRALRRLVGHHRLAVLQRGFYIIVPLEYRSVGAPPPPWFLDAFMKMLHRPYYVGLLSAAALYGAAHQQPQEFQVVTDKPLRPIQVGRTRLRFLTKQEILHTPTQDKNTPSGIMKVSIPEATALDLVRYLHVVGTLDQVATVFTELQEQVRPEPLKEILPYTPLSVIQRVGYLFELLGNETLSVPLLSWVRSHACHTVPLSPGQAIQGEPIERRWHLIVNTTVEADE